MSGRELVTRIVITFIVIVFTVAYIHSTVEPVKPEPEKKETKIGKCYIAAYDKEMKPTSLICKLEKDKEIYYRYFKYEVPQEITPKQENGSTN